MARRKPFDEYKSTTKLERIIERKKLRVMQDTRQYDNWLIRMFYYQHNECYYCDEQISYPDRESYHIEHRIPVYWGGKSDYPNLCLACPHFNITKGTDQLIRNKRHLKKNVIYL